MNNLKILLISCFILALFVIPASAQREIEWCYDHDAIEIDTYYAHGGFTYDATTLNGVMQATEGYNYLGLATQGSGVINMAITLAYIEESENYAFINAFGYQRAFPAQDIPEGFNQYVSDTFQVVPNGESGYILSIESTLTSGEYFHISRIRIEGWGDDPFPPETPGSCAVIPIGNLNPYANPTIDPTMDALTGGILSLQATRTALESGYSNLDVTESDVTYDGESILPNPDPTTYLIVFSYIKWIASDGVYSAFGPFAPIPIHLLVMMSVFLFGYVSNGAIKIGTLITQAVLWVARWVLRLWEALPELIQTAIFIGIAISILWYILGKLIEYLANSIFF